MSRSREIGGLQRKLRTILLEHWDPLGVGLIGAAEDEYERQEHRIISMMQHGPLPIDVLRQYLDDEAYALARSWDDDEALDRTARLIMGLQRADQA